MGETAIPALQRGMSVGRKESKSQARGLWVGLTGRFSGSFGQTPHYSPEWSPGSMTCHLGIEQGASVNLPAP